MSKHTPGPWEIVASLAGNDRIIVEAYGFGAVASVSLNGAPLHQDRLSPESPHHQKQSDTYMANARLIAAAPEMYAIIDYFVQLVEDGIETDVIKFTEDGCFSQAKALLAKIDGGE